MKAWRGFGIGIALGLVFLAGYAFRSSFAQNPPRAAQAAVKLPPDIYPESFARVPWPKKEDFTSPEEIEAFDRVNNRQTPVEVGPRSLEPKGPLGPTPLRMHVPVVAENYYKSFRWIRDKAGLELRYVELAILISARESNDQYQWMEHQRTSSKVVPQATRDVVRDRKATTGLEHQDAILIQFGREMYQQPKVSSKTFAEMERAFGRKHTMALTLLMAHYTANALLLHAYDQHLGPSHKPELPIP